MSAITRILGMSTKQRTDDDSIDGSRVAKATVAPQQGSGGPSESFCLTARTAGSRDWWAPQLHPKPRIAEPEH